MKKYEQGFNTLKNFYEKFYNNSGNENSFELFKGQEKNVMFSCPHAVSQTREGKEKVADINTGPLGMSLNSLGYSVLIKTQNCNDDANYDIKSEYKDFLSKYIKENNIKYLIDLHGMSKKRDVLISLGTCFGVNSDKSLELTHQFIKIANKNGIDAEKIRVDFPFFASKRTVSSVISKRNRIETLQLEINSKIYDDKSQTIGLIKTLDEFACLVSKVKMFKTIKLKAKDVYQNEKTANNHNLTQPFQLFDNHSEIVVAAPHACSMIKEGKECYQETFSGAIVKLLSDRYNLSACIKVNKTQYDSSEEYEKTICSFVEQAKVKLLLEFHVMNSKRYEDVTLLTNRGYSINNNMELMSMFMKTLILNRFTKLSLDYPFNAFNLNSSVAKIYKKTNVPSIQFIINQRVFNNKMKLNKMLICVSEIIQKLNYVLE